ncbi:hypothetical protein [uncultured Microbacterium sp.]|uniref:hypothetical protein n=1 Tax=uncultured Microbacterium sp. TaxID=191216 RepID=UPI0025E01D6B|nr:hypothetical protein [uncultured Microbacterium sp.]
MSTERDAAYAVVDELAEWSDWRPFFEVAEGAPTSPGVYQMRLRDGLIVYVGMAGSVVAKVSADGSRSTDAAKAR